MTNRLNPWLGAAIVAAASASLAARRTSTHRNYPALPKRPTPRHASGPFMRFVSMALFLALAALTVGYLLTGGQLDFLKQFVGLAGVPAPCIRFAGLDHDGTEYWMLFAAALLAGAGLILAFGMEHDSNAVERWRAYAVLRLTRTGLLTDAEAIALIAPTIEATWRQRFLSLPPRVLIPKRMTATLPGGRVAALAFTGDDATLQVADDRGVVHAADFA